MKNYKGFTVVEGLLILIIVGILGFTGWYVFSARNKATDDLNSIGSKSDPIANTRNVSQSTPQAGSTSNLANSSTPTYASGGYLKVSQWSVNIPVDDSVSGLYYTLAKNGVATFRDKALDDVSNGCTSNSLEVGGGTADWHVANELGTQDGTTYLDAYNSALSYKDQNSRGVAVHVMDDYFVVPDYAGASCASQANQAQESDALLNIVKAVNKMVSFY